MAVRLSFDGEEITADIDFSAELTAAAGAVEAEAKELCPVDTGYLKNSISSSSDDVSAVISASADYAAYVEFGTAKAAAQPYLVPALLNSAAKILSAFKTAEGENNG